MGGFSDALDAIYELSIVDSPLVMYATLMQFIHRFDFAGWFWCL